MRRPSNGIRPYVAGVVAAFVLMLACASCKFLKDEFTFLDRAAPPAPPPPAGTDAGR